MSKSQSQRLVVPYANESDKFALKSHAYSKQFAHVYAFRLKEISKLLETRIAAKWPTYPVRKLADLREETPEKCVIIGTLFKQQEFKPSILREISEENQLAPQPPRQHYAGPNDKLILEDELQRVILVGNVDIQNETTGVVCGVLGIIVADGKFEVDECLYYEGGPQKPLKNLETAPLLVLMSGLSQTQAFNYSLSLDLFQNWLSGNCGNDPDSSRIVRLVIAGNSVRSTSEFTQSALHTRKSESFSSLTAMKALDNWFSSWSESVHIDVMPGEFDPSNFMLPQQPFHRCMFPEANRNASFQSVCNPYACSIAGRSIMGTSGQNVDSILRTTSNENALEALRYTLRWSHVAPTCPDTLACYPYVENDPFIIKECPHVYFAGNAEKFKTDLHIGPDGQKTRLILVPSFEKTQTVVVVNLQTLDCNNVSFKISNYVN